MNSRRKQTGMSEMLHLLGTGAVVARESFPPEAYDYPGGISPEDVRRLQEQADAALGERDDWEVVDGFVGRR